MSTAVDFKNVDIMFGQDTAPAVAMLDAGATHAACWLVGSAS